MSVPDLPRILSIGAEVRTPIGYLGFVAACTFLFFLVKRQPKGKGASTPAAWRRRRFVLVLSAGVFLVSVAIVSFAPPSPPSPPPQPVPSPAPRQRTPADERVIGYMAEVLKLKGDYFEPRDPGWSEQVRKEGLRLADLLGKENPEELSTSRKIIQAEYKGWALSMVARSFVEEVEPEAERKRQQIEYATQAIQEFDRALELMNGVAWRLKQPGDKGDLVEVYKWMTGDESDDLNRTHYMKAVAAAVIARAGGNRTKQDVRDELKNVSEYYLRAHPRNPDLNWALKD